jgi:hypothetical protein
MTPGDRQRRRSRPGGGMVAPCRSWDSTAMASPARTTASHRASPSQGSGPQRRDRSMSGGPDCRTPGGGRPDGADLGGPQRAGPRQPRRVGRSRREEWSARQRARTRGVGPAGSAEVPRFRSPASGAPLDQITRIQQEVLVPLELWLIQRSEVETVTLRQAVGAACMRSTAATSAADEAGRTVEFPLLAARLYRRGITTGDACRPPAAWDHLSELSARSMGPAQRQ